MNEQLLELYWNEIPIGKENAWTYDKLCSEWVRDKRQVRVILHELSGYDNGDNLILIRSSKGPGFYRTDDKADIAEYRAECLQRGKRTFAPLRKIDRVLAPDDGQLSMSNNIKAVRIARGMQQTEVCERMRQFDPAFDVPMLSKMENDRAWPSPLQLAHLAAILNCSAIELVDVRQYQTAL